MSITVATAPLHLIGYHTRYSSWTARVVLVLEYFDIPYQASYFQIYTEEGRKALKQYSPTGKGPVLIPASFPSSASITDSLAIVEYLAECHPELPLWPRDAVLRALARSAVAEMHSGFTAVRNTYHSNFTGKYTGNVPISPQARSEIERLLELWDSARRFTTHRLAEANQETMDEGWLFGTFGIADAFFWPVLWRFRSYGLPLDTVTPETLAWMKKMWSHPVMKSQAAECVAQTKRPETYSENYEDVFKDNTDVVYEPVGFGPDWEFCY